MRDWLIFIRTAETGSLSETARQLDISTAAARKSICRFERYPDTVLFTVLSHYEQRGGRSCTACFSGNQQIKLLCR
nr:LysR family transcriptional regulator [Rahnella sp. AN3-3W3]